MPLLTQVQLQVGNPFPPAPDIFIGFVAPAPQPITAPPELPPIALPPYLAPLVEFLPALATESDTGLLAQMQELAQRLGLLPTTPALEEYELTAPVFVAPVPMEPEFAAIAPPVVPPPPAPTAFEDELPPNWGELMQGGLFGRDPLNFPRWVQMLPGAFMRALTPGALNEPTPGPLPGAADPFAPAISPIGLPDPVLPAAQPIADPGVAPSVRPDVAPYPFAAPGLAPGVVPLPSLGTSPRTTASPSSQTSPLTFAAPGTGTPLGSPSFGLAPSLGRAPSFAEDPAVEPQAQTLAQQKQCVETKQKDKQKKRKKHQRKVCHVGTYREFKSGLAKHPRRIVQCQ